MSTTSRILASLTPLALLAACDPGSHALPSAPGNGITAMMFSTEGTPWSAPVNLGSVINTSGIEAGSDLSVDGHLLFFHSNRPGSLGGNDIYVSRRADPNDDFGWGPPTPLGPDVNTSFDENAPTYVQSAEDGSANLYFTRGDAATQAQDLYVAAITRDGETRGPAVLAAELNTIVNDAAPTIRIDGGRCCSSPPAPAHWASPISGNPGAKTSMSLGPRRRTSGHPSTRRRAINSRASRTTAGRSSGLLIDRVASVASTSGWRRARRAGTRIRTYTPWGLFFSRPITTVMLSSPPRSSASCTSR